MSTLVPFRAVTRHHGEFSVMGTPSLQPFLKSYWLTPVQMTGQLSQSMQIWRARDSINAMPATITSESSTSPVEFVMATVCKICAGPIEPLDHHLHCVACLGLAHAEAALDESDCGHCAPGPLRYGSRPIRGGAHCCQCAAGGPPLSWWRQRRLAVPPNPTVAPFPGFLSRGLFLPPLQHRGVRILWPRGGGWCHVHLGLGERGLGGIGARSIKQLRAFRPPRGAHEGSI